jgi:2,4-dienoyl-CoA reductase-like NADH-dependent reductase (Old Yellow Enzyme family)
MALKLALQPITINGVILPNRIARAAHETGIAKPDINDGFIEYHAARARGGCGLTILEAAGVHPSSDIDLRVYGPTIVDGYRRLMEAVNPYGMIVFQQLWHAGNLYPAANGGPPWAVSDIPAYTGVVGHPMSLADIAELKAAFVNAARLCQEGGVHGVEIHGCHGYIIHQFLSPLYNNRTDQYGGDSFENRTRFLTETLRDIRQAVGPDYPVGVRLGASDLPGGIDVAINQQVARMLESERLIDFLDLSVGDYYRMETMVGTMHVPARYELPTTGEIASVVSVPRIVTGRFRALDEVEEVLKDGIADIVSLTRAQIADPDLVAKTVAGHPELVRPCIACNQGCIGGLQRAGKLGCAVNSTVGREMLHIGGPGARAGPARRILVIGGGPAGMEAARVAALYGHSVILAEAQPNLGGTINLAKRMPNLAPIGDIAFWLEQELYRLGVDVRLNSYVDADEIAGFGVDEVIIATGSLPRDGIFQLARPSLNAEIDAAARLITTHDLVTGFGLDGCKSALVFDTVGGFEGVSAAEYLLTQGLSVTYVTQLKTFAPLVQVTFREIPYLERFNQTGRFSLHLRHQLNSVGRDHGVIQPLQGAQSQSLRVDADVIVAVMPNKPVRDVYDAFRAGGGKAHLIGDASSPRDLQVAIAEGYEVARQLSCG